MGVSWVCHGDGSLDTIVMGIVIEMFLLTQYQICNIFLVEVIEVQRAATEKSKTDVRAKSTSTNAGRRLDALKSEKGNGTTTTSPFINWPM